MPTGHQGLVMVGFPLPTQEGWSFLGASPVVFGVSCTSLWRWAMWYSSDSVGSEIVKGKKSEFCSVLKRKDKSLDNTLGLQWSFFYIDVTQMVEWRKSESTGCNKVTVVEAPCCRNASVYWQKREECPRAHTAFSCVLHHSLCQLPASLKKRDASPKLVLLSPCFYTDQMKCRDYLCDCISLFVSILWKHSN